MSRAALKPVLFLCLLCFAVANVASAQVATCVQGRATDYDFPFLGLQTVTGSNNVTIFLNDAARNSSALPVSRIGEATEKWNDGCKDFTRAMPRFSVNAKDPRPAGGDERYSNTWRSTVLIEFKPNDYAPVDGDGAHPAQWSSNHNVIVIYGRCPSDGTYNMDCVGGPGGLIRWDTPWGAAVIAHELGHPLGLAEDRTSCTSHGIMKFPFEPGDENNLGVGLYCSFVDSANDSEAPCNTDPGQLTSGETHPCERPGVGERPFPPRVGSSFDVCEESPWACYDGTPSWGGGATCNYACVTTSFFGGSDTTCSWGCYYAVITASAEDAETETSSADQEGVGPTVLVTSPAEGQTVSGIVTISGWATDLSRGVNLQFGIDDLEVSLQSFVKGTYNAAACQPPQGIHHSACDPNAGFSGRLDTTFLTNGPHVLRVHATDVHGWPTMHDVTFYVDNGPCGDVVPPTVGLTAPGNGSSAFGIVNVAANASDNVGVTRVEFLIDNSVAATDTVAPYGFSWNASSYTPGAHTLRARSYDNCGNTTSSQQITVHVLADTNAPQVSLTSPTANALVRGSVPVTAQASDNTGVSRVDFYIDGALTSTDSTSPYSFSWSTTSSGDGAHSLYAKAFDSAGNSATSATVTVKVDNTAPRAYIDGPAPGATVSGTSVQLIGWATDLSRITSLAFRLDGQPLALNSSYTYGLYRQDVCNVHPGDPSCPYVGWQAFFDSTRFAAGSHTLEVVATDGAGLTVTAQRTFNINNDRTAPTVSITAPANGATVKGTVLITASASDNVGVTKVEFYVDGVLVSTDTTSPYSYSWNTLMGMESTQTLMVKAYDAYPNTSSASISVTVDNYQPKIRVVSGDGVTISRGGTYWFQNTTAGTPISRAFSIYNDGTDTLAIYNPSSLVSSTGGFSLIVDAPATIGGGSSGAFRVRLYSMTAGSYTGTVTIQSNDPGGNFTFTVRGTVDPAPAPIVRIVSPEGATVLKGSTYTFPSTPKGTALGRVFTIYNDGNATLTISNPTSLLSSPGGFSQIVDPPASIAPGSSGIFRIRLYSTTAGTYTGTVTLQSNTSPFTFYVRGTVN